MKSIKNINFEDALAELEAIVKKIDSGEENLANTVSSFERAMELKKHCEEMLQEAKLKIEKISNNSRQEVNIDDIKV